MIERNIMNATTDSPVVGSLSYERTVDDVLADLEVEANRIVVDEYNANIAPILRKISGYTGEFTFAAKSTIKMDAVTGKLDNQVAVSIVFPDDGYVDPFEIAQRLILTESLRYFLSKN